jgi:DNA-binding NtrC family response regulator
MKPGLRVLVADSDQHSRELLCNLLLLAGNDVVLARNRQEALRMVRDLVFDAVVVNVKALQRSVIRTLKEMERLRPQVAILVCCAQPEYAPVASVEGYSLVYEKFFLETAPELLRQAVSRRQARALRCEPERRAVRRLKDQIPVEYRLVGEDGAMLEPAGQALTRDLSPAGLMLEADRQLAPMSVLHLDFALGSPPCFLKALGRLCWIHEEAADQYSLGVCFTMIDDEDRNWISNYVDLHWDSASRAIG